MKTYEEIDLDESPIIVLGCGHFFTAESLDGLIGMAEVYEQDERGEFNGLQDASHSLARSIPRCPDCQRPVRQYSTQRFNRVINRAVIDEMSKRFLVDGKDKLQKLRKDIVGLDSDFRKSLDEILALIRPAKERNVTHQTDNLTPAEGLEILIKLKDRFDKARKLEKGIRSFREKVKDKNQPAHKLYEATVIAARQKSVDQMMMDLDISSSVPVIARDRRVTFGGRIAELQAECIILTDKFHIAKLLKTTTVGASLKLPGGAPEQLAKPFFNTCKTFIVDCNEESLPKLCVEATLYYARLAHSNQSYCRSIRTETERASEHVLITKELLEKAKQLCAHPFQNAEQLRYAVEQYIKIFGKEWYEEVTPHELDAIKVAMLDGPRGFATHSGHWYNCANGHPVSPEWVTPRKTLIL